MDDDFLNAIVLLVLLAGGAYLLYRYSATGRLAAISGYGAAASNTPLASLGGATLASYEPSYAFQPIATVPLTNFDVNQMAVPVGS